MSAVSAGEGRGRDRKLMARMWQAWDRDAAYPSNVVQNWFHCSGPTINLWPCGVSVSRAATTFLKSSRAEAKTELRLAHIVTSNDNDGGLTNLTNLTNTSKRKSTKSHTCCDVFV